MKRDQGCPRPFAGNEFVERFGTLLHEMSARMHQHLAASACSVGLPVPLALALLDLDPERPRPMNELAGALGCDPSNVTGIADRLERRGLVQRQLAPRDRRVKELRVTAEGAKLRAAFQHRLARVPLRVDALAEEERAVLLDLLQRLLAVEAAAAGCSTKLADAMESDSRRAPDERACRDASIVDSPTRPRAHPVEVE